MYNGTHVNPTDFDLFKPILRFSCKFQGYLFFTGGKKNANSCVVRFFSFFFSTKKIDVNLTYNQIFTVHDIYHYVAYFAIRSIFQYVLSRKRNNTKS